MEQKEYQLKNGKIVSLIPKGKSMFQEGTQNSIGYLTIIGKVESDYPGITKILCKCKCGNYTTLTLQAFKRETTKSCGCYNSEIRKKIMC